MIAGCEWAWTLSGGTFRVLVPDNVSPVVTGADPVNLTFTAAGWKTPRPAGSGPTGASSLSRGQAGATGAVQFVRENFFYGQSLLDLADAQRRVEQWCAAISAGLRSHG